MKVIVINNIIDRIAHLEDSTAYGPFFNTESIKRFISIIDQRKSDVEIVEVLDRDQSNRWFVYPAHDRLITKLQKLCTNQSST